MATGATLFANLIFFGGSNVEASDEQIVSKENKKQRPAWLAFAGRHTWNNSPEEFDRMLESMGPLERVSLAQSLRMFPDIAKGHFGMFGLKPYQDYPSDQRPKTYNDVPADIALKAIKAVAIDGQLISPKSIRNQFLWVSSSVFTYPVKYGVYYHDIVKWVAKKYGVTDEDIQALPTFDLERKILEVSFVQVWDKLDEKGRLQVLNAIEQNTGTTISQKGAIACLGGAGALTALSATVAFTGFTFYTTMSVVMCTVAGIFGITLPFVVYTTASTTIAVLAGPVGWIIAGVMAAAGIILMLGADFKKSAAFVLALHLLKAEAYHEAGEL